MLNIHGLALKGEREESRRKAHESRRIDTRRLCSGGELPEFDIVCFQAHPPRVQGAIAAGCSGCLERGPITRLLDKNGKIFATINHLLSHHHSRSQTIATSLPPGIHTGRSALGSSDPTSLSGRAASPDPNQPDHLFSSLLSIGPSSPAYVGSCCDDALPSPSPSHVRDQRPPIVALVAPDRRSMREMC